MPQVVEGVIKMRVEGGRWRMAGLGRFAFARHLRRVAGKCEENFFGTVTQGSVCDTTLGWRMEPRWGISKWAKANEDRGASAHCPRIKNRVERGVYAASALLAPK